MPRWPHGRMTREQALARRRDLYLWRKLNGFCVSCRAWLPDGHGHVHCLDCIARQSGWQQAHPESGRARSARYYAKQQQEVRS